MKISDVFPFYVRILIENLKDKRDKELRLQAKREDKLSKKDDLEIKAIK